MMSKNYQQTVLQLLLGIRRDRSTMALSRAMGYNYNQVKRWENGEKQLRWDEFCEYCSVLQIPLSQTLLQIFQYDQADPRGFLVHLYANKFPLYSIRVLAKKLHRHASAVRRYLHQEVFPDLEFVLTMIDLDTNELSKFISSLLKQDAGPSGELPLLAAVHGWLQSDRYQALDHHQSGFLAKCIGCSVTEVDDILRRMVAVQLIAQTPNGKFQITQKILPTLAGNSSLQSKTFQYWLERAALHSSASGPTSCQVIPASRETVRMINDILLRADFEIRLALEKSTGPYEDVRVILLKTFSTYNGSSFENEDKS